MSLILVIWLGTGKVRESKEKGKRKVSHIFKAVFKNLSLVKTPHMI